ncbi:hypothetical protein Tco_1360145 [Tanacetum coccineum]
MAGNSFSKSLKKSKSSKQLIAGLGDGSEGMAFSLSFSESVFKSLVKGDFQPERLAQQDIDNEGEVDKEDEGGGEVGELDDLNNEKNSITWQSMVWIEEDAKRWFS